MPYQLGERRKKPGGRCAIRTRGAVSGHGLANRCNRPLCQSSKCFRSRVPAPPNFCGRFPHYTIAGTALLFLVAGEGIEPPMAMAYETSLLPTAPREKLKIDGVTQGIRTPVYQDENLVS